MAPTSKCWGSFKTRVRGNVWLGVAASLGFVSVCLGFVSTLSLGEEEGVTDFVVRLMARHVDGAHRYQAPGATSAWGSHYTAGHLCWLAGLFSVPQCLFAVLVLSCKVRGAAPADWALGVLAVAQLLILLPWHGVGMCLFTSYALEYRRTPCVFGPHGENLSCKAETMMSLFCFLEAATDCALVQVTLVLLVLSSALSLGSVGMCGWSIGTQVYGRTLGARRDAGRRPTRGGAFGEAVGGAVGGVVALSTGIEEESMESDKLLG